MFIRFKFPNDFNCMYWCIYYGFYSVVFIYWLIDCIYWLAPSSEFYISWTSHLFARTVSFLRKCYDVHTNANTASFPSLPTQIQHSTHWIKLQAVSWKTLFNSQKKKKSPTALKAQFHLLRKTPRTSLEASGYGSVLPMQWASVSAPCLEAWLPCAAWHSQKENRPQGNKTYVQRCPLRYYL